MIIAQTVMNGWINTDFIYRYSLLISCVKVRCYDPSAFFSFILDQYCTSIVAIVDNMTVIHAVVRPNGKQSIGPIKLKG